MKYIKNNGRYAVSFAITKNGREVKIVFDRRRVYLDTGNIATSGITEIEDSDFVELKKLKRFSNLLETKEFEEVDSIKPVDNTEEIVKAKDAEIDALKKQLEEKKATPSKKELAEKDKEIKTLKAELEALKAKKDETEGF